MRLFSIFTLLITGFISSFVQAEKMPLLTDSSITTSAEILNRIQQDSMALIKAKYSDIQKNYTTHFLTTGLEFHCRSNGDVAGDNDHFAALRISNDQKETANGAVIKYSSVSHFDCTRKLIFIERIKVIAKPGIVPTSLSVSDAVKFVRYFEVQENETARQYQIENANGEIIFSVSSQRLALGEGERIYTMVEFVGQKWLEFDQHDPNVNQRRLYIHINPGTFRYGRSRSNINFDNGQALVPSFVWTDKKIEYYINNIITNQNDFDSNISSLVIEMTVNNMLNVVFNDFISVLPKTKKIQIGVSDSPFLRELQLNYNRLLTNTDEALVKNFLQKTIDDIKAGRLKVEQ